MIYLVALGIPQALARCFQTMAHQSLKWICSYRRMVLECWRDVKTPTSKCWCAILESKSHCNKSTHVFSFKSGGVRFALRWVSNFLELVGLSRLWVYKSDNKKHISHPQLKPKGCNGSTFRNCVLYNMATCCFKKFASYPNQVDAWQGHVLHVCHLKKKI